MNPLDSCSIEYRYDANRFYFVSSSPEYWKRDEEDGLILFNLSGAKTGKETYEVFLDTCLAGEIKVKEGTIEGIECDEKNVKTQRKNDHEWMITGLRPDSHFTVKVSENKPNNVSCSLKARINSEPEEIVDNDKTSYIYTVKLGDGKQFVFIPSEYTKEHGKLKYGCNGREINERITLNAGMEIEYEVLETEEGYWLPEGKGTIKVNGEETASKLAKVQFYPYIKVSVLLDKPDVGGTVSYYAEGRELTGTSADLYCGTRITARAEADEGWELQIQEDEDYIVTELNNQVICIGNKAVSEFFKEKESHKPSLTIRINTNLGQNCKTGIETSGIDRKIFITKTGDTFYSPYKTVIQNENIGTDRSIKLTFSNMDFKEKQKVMAFLLRRGYSMDAIRREMDRI